MLSVLQLGQRLWTTYNNIKMRLYRCESQTCILTDAAGQPHDCRRAICQVGISCQCRDQEDGRRCEFRLYDVSSLRVTESGYAGSDQ